MFSVRINFHIQSLAIVELSFSGYQHEMENRGLQTNRSELDINAITQILTVLSGGIAFFFEPLSAPMQSHKYTQVVSLHRDWVTPLDAWF